MSITDLFRFGFINLWRRKTRTFLTALSMAIGVMCIVVLISVGLGYEQSYRESVESMGSLTKIDVRPADETLRDTVALLNDKAVEAIKQVDGVEAVTPVVNQAAYIKSGNYVNMVTLYGIDLSTAASFQLVPLEGTLPGEGARLQPEIMLTDDVAPTFSIPANDWADAVDANGDPLVDPLSADMRLTFDYSNLSGKQQADTDGRALPPGKLYRLHVTGVCSSQNNTYRTSAFLDLTRMQELLAANADFLGSNASTDKDSAAAKAAKETGPTYELVWVKCKAVDDVQRISKLIQKSGLSTYSLNDMLETVRAQSRQIQGVLGAIGAVAMLVAAICVANTMMMSITERTREIGVLKVLGTTLGNISGLFLIEALLVGVFGGLMGLGLSFLMQKAIPFLFEEQQVRSLIPAWLAGFGVAFSGVMALLAAFIPARNAMRVSPNEAIRAQ